MAGRRGSAPETPKPRAERSEAQRRKGGGTWDAGGVGRVGRNQERTLGRKARSASKTQPLWHYLVLVTSAEPTCSMSTTGRALLPPKLSAQLARQRLRAEGILAAALLPPLGPPSRGNGRCVGLQLRPSASASAPTHEGRKWGLLLKLDFQKVFLRIREWGSPEASSLLGHVGLAQWKTRELLERD